MRLCIAEKPSVAREIARILGANTRRDGYMEGNGYQVSWTFGHLCTLKEPNEYNEQWKHWNIRYLPMIPDKFGIKVISEEGVKKQFDILKKLISEADEIINCGDAGQEGELIQRWVLTKAKNKAPVKRLWISSLTEEAIKEGFNKLLDGKDFDSLYEAGSARAIGDWLLGINATRLYTIKYGQHKQMLSVGRVQTPTLALIVARQKEINNFKSEPYWEIKTTYRETVFSSAGGRFKTAEEASGILQQIIGKDLFIGKITTKKGSEHPPKLFDLTSLQVECNKKFSLSADDTLKNIQSLYEKKVTTYPRVDTTYLSDDIYKKVPDILKNMKNITGYATLVDPILQGKEIRKSSKVFDNKKITDHHAIIPTGQYRVDLTEIEKKIFDLIAKRFLAVFYSDCQFAGTTVEAAVNEHAFKTTGKQILEPGWRVLFMQDPKDEEEKEEEENNKLLPEFQTGEHGPHKPDLQEKQTQPPAYYTEATLLRAMETAGKNIDDEELRELIKESGIGRPSTRSNIIETLFKRRYISKERKRLVATQTGIDLIDTIENDLLKSAELTGQWERKLRQIESGNMKVDQFMAELRTMVSEVVEQVKRAPRKEITILEKPEPKPEPAKEEKEPQKRKSIPVGDIICPKCKTGKLIQGKSAWGCTEWRNGCRFTIPFVLCEKKLTEKQVSALAAKGKTPAMKGIQFNGLKFDGQFVLSDTLQLELVPKISDDAVCPKCKQGKVIKGNTAWGCSNFRNGCNFRLPFVITR